MGRRTSSGRIGAPTFGGLLASAETIKSDDNKDITLDPTGTGIVKVDGDFQMQSTSTIRFADSNSSNYVGFRGANTINSNLTWTLPSADGSSGQVLSTDGSGTLSWAATGITITDNTTDSNTNYIYFNTNTSGTATSIRSASTKLTFQPSTGKLTCTELSATTITETSSIVYKENISPIENALESITKLAGVLYDRKDGSSKNEAGLIAEEVEKVIPNIVSYKEGKAEGIQYTKLSVYLIEAIKEIKEEINNLRAR